MESRAKLLRQQRATLGARQGDPEAPAPGTLYGRLKRLNAELEQIEAEQAVFAVRLARANHRSGRATVGVVSSRSVEAIRRDLRCVEEEIERNKQQIEDVNILIAQAEGSSRVTSF